MEHIKLSLGVKLHGANYNLLTDLTLLLTISWDVVLKMKFAILQRTVHTQFCGLTASRILLTRFVTFSAMAPFKADFIPP